MSQSRSQEAGGAAAPQIGCHEGLIRYIISRSMASLRVALGRYARRVRQILMPKALATTRRKAHHFATY